MFKLIIAPLAVSLAIIGLSGETAKAVEKSDLYTNDDPGEGVWDWR